MKELLAAIDARYNIDIRGIVLVVTVSLVFLRCSFISGWI
jgi:hypothetical protein